MKRIVCGLMMVLTTAALAADPKVGDTREQVMDLLGNPKGRMATGGNEVLVYDRGTVDLAGGKVTSVKLVTEGELAAREAAAARQARLDEERHRKLVAEGTAEKGRVLADPEFAKKTPAEQAAYWREFSSKYPGVDIKGISQAAEQALQEDERKKQEAERAAAIASQKLEQPPPRLSSSKARKAYRMKQQEEEAPQP